MRPRSTRRRPPRTATPKQSRQERHRLKREALVRAAARAFGSKAGFRGATIEGISAALHMTKTNLYHYFETKEELLYEVQKLAIPDVMGEIDRILELPDPADVKFALAIKAHVRGLATKYEGCYLLQQDSELSDIHRAKILAEWDSYQRKLLRILKDGIRAGVFAIRDEKITLYAVLGAVNWFVRWYSSSGRLDFEEIADIFTDVFFNGILATRKDLRP